MRHRALALSALASCALAGCYIDDPLVYLPLDGGGGGTPDGGTGGAGGSGGGATSSSPCSANAECNDDNPCTMDVCKPAGCAHEPLPAGTSCGSDDACKGIDRCDGFGVCISDDPPQIDDGDACTADICDPVTGSVTHTLRPGCAAPISVTGAPSPRYKHAAVWTGTQMLVWGGSGTEFPPALGTGGRYDPSTNTWSPMATDGAPPPRHSHCAAWTGSRMLVWGGFGTSTLENTGGVYDPATDTWSSMTTTGAPSGRTGMACAWTGKELVVWGGTTGPGVTGTGGRYDPATNTWKSLPASNAPTPRYGHSAVWTGTRVIFWGGNDLFDWHLDGTSYDPATDAWTGSTPLPNAPLAREVHTAIWTGSRMVVWGGFTGGEYLDQGGSLDPVGGKWTATSTAGAPSPREQHTAVWTGSTMIVWGGCGMDSCVQLLGDGGIWTPDTRAGSWTAIPPSADVAPRRGATSVWTGITVLIWGGRTSKGETDTGAILHP